MRTNLMARLVCVAFAALLAFLTFLDGWYTVNQGDRAVVLRFGRVIYTSDPGFHFKAPFMDAVRKMSVRTIKIVSKTEVYSKDIQAATIAISLNYSLNPASVADIYTRYSLDFEQRIIIPQIMAKLKDVFGRYNAVEIVRSRDKIAFEVAEDMRKHLAETGIQIASVQIENIDYSKEYEKSVEERMKAEVEVEKVRQQLEREKLLADMRRAKAKGEADAWIMAAEAEAKAIKMKGEAEATAVKAKADALAKNPELVDLIQAERWDGKLPTTIPPLGTVPIIGVK